MKALKVLITFKEWQNNIAIALLKHSFLLFVHTLNSSGNVFALLKDHSHITFWECFTSERITLLPITLSHFVPSNNAQVYSK
jgi:hypothetical protein